MGTQQYYQSSLAVTSRGPGRLDVFGFSPADRQVYRQWVRKYLPARSFALLISLQWEEGGAWQNDSWPSESACGSGLAATSWTAGRLDIFGLDGDKAISHNSFDHGQSQGPWDPM